MEGLIIRLCYLHAVFSAPGAARPPQTQVERTRLTNISSARHMEEQMECGNTYIKVRGQSLKIHNSIGNRAVVNFNFTTFQQLLVGEGIVLECLPVESKLVLVQV